MNELSFGGTEKFGLSGSQVMAWASSPVLDARKCVWRVFIEADRSLAA
jgi:hypothetical protein